MPAQRLNTFHDNSGLITVSVFSQRSPAPDHIFLDHGAAVPDDMVVIGGGALGAEYPGALLTASYPNDQLTGWLGSAKDHKDPTTYYFTTYAIGLQIAGMAREAVRDAIFVSTADSGIGDYPEATANVPEGFFSSVVAFELIGPASVIWQPRRFL